MSSQPRYRVSRDARVLVRPGGFEWDIKQGLSVGVGGLLDGERRHGSPTVEALRRCPRLQLKGPTVAG